MALRNGLAVGGLSTAGAHPPSISAHRVAGQLILGKRHNLSGSDGLSRRIQNLDGLNVERA